MISLWYFVSLLDFRMFFVWRDILNFSAEQQPSGFGNNEYLEINDEDKHKDKHKDKITSIFNHHHVF